MKILFAPQSTSLTHVGRSLTLARALAERGHDITFAGESRFLQNPDFIGEPFFRFVELQDIPASVVIRKTQAAQGLSTSQMINDLINIEISFLRQENFDLVVGDLRPTIFISAMLSETPSVSLLNVRWFPKMYARSFIAPGTLRTPSEWHEELAPLSPEERAERIVWLNQAAVAEPFNEPMQKLGLPPVEYYCDLLEGDLNLFLDTAFFAPTIGLQEGFHQIGPIFWHPPWEAPKWIDDLPLDPPLVYVTYGSFTPQDLFIETIKMLKRKDVQVVVHTMRQRPPLPDLPPNVRVVEEMRDERIFSKAAFVICHAGNQTVYEAIRGSAPLLCVASHVGQEFVAEDVRRLRMGLSCTTDSILEDPRRLERLFDELMERRSEFTKRMQLAHDDLLCHNGVETAIARIEETFGV